jgi:hypothetical protein
MWGWEREVVFDVERSSKLSCLFVFFSFLLSYLVSFHCIKALELEAEKEEEVTEGRLYPREKLKYSSRFYV